MSCDENSIDKRRAQETILGAKQLGDAREETSSEGKARPIKSCRATASFKSITHVKVRCDGFQQLPLVRIGRARSGVRGCYRGRSAEVVVALEKFRAVNFGGPHRPIKQSWLLLRAVQQQHTTCRRRCCCRPKVVDSCSDNGRLCQLLQVRCCRCRQTWPPS